MVMEGEREREGYNLRATLSSIYFITTGRQKYINSGNEIKDSLN